MCLAGLVFQQIHLFLQGVHLGTELVVAHLQTSRLFGQRLGPCLGCVAFGLLLGQEGQPGADLRELLCMSSRFGRPAPQIVDTIGQPPPCQVEFVPGGIYGPFEFALLFLDLDNVGQSPVPGCFGLACLPQGRVSLFYLLSLGQHGLIGGKLLLSVRELSLYLADFLLGLGQPPVQIAEAGLLVLQGLLLLMQVPLHGLCVLEGGAQFGNTGFRSSQLGLVFRLAIQFAVNVAKPALQLGHFPILLASLFLGLPFILVIETQAQNLAQDTFALGRRARRKSIGFALDQKGRVGKGLIVDAQQADDGCVGGTHARLGNGTKFPKPIRPLHLQIHHGAAPSSRIALADDAIDSPTQVKREFDLHLGLAQVDQLIIPLGTGLAPQRPGHGIEQGRLAVTVGPR